ncbi:MAG: hypothetical protein P8X73_14870 [Ignavibacteriaceae bacterium]
MTSFIKHWFVIFFIVSINNNSLPQECKALLTIQSDIEEIFVFVDDTLAGNGKTVDINLEPGSYKIVTTENTRLWDARSFIDTLEIEFCENINLKYKFNSEVLLNSEPQDAQVFSNDSLMGYTPLLIPMEFDRIRLEKFGYETAIVNYAEFNENQPVRLNFTGEIDEGKFFDKTLFKVLVGSMLALGVATAYFKLEADTKFDEYQITGDDELLTQTNRLDEISGVTFVAMQINFGLIIYFFLVE